MEKKKIHLRFGVISAMILFAAMSRLLPHPPNFAPIGAMALFGAAYYTKRYWAYLIPVATMWISDLVLNNIVYGQYFDHFVWFYSGSVFIYLAFGLIVLMGSFTLKKIKFSRIAVSTLGASLIFFIVSNFGVWFSSGMYPHTWSGLLACYAAGIPFFGNTLLGDVVYTGVLFGLFGLLQYRFPALKLQKAATL